MVEAKCPHCGNTTFSLTHHTEIAGDAHNHHLVICTRCQAPVTVMSKIDPGVESRRIKAELDQLQVTIQVLSAKVGRLAALQESPSEASPTPDQ